MNPSLRRRLIVWLSLSILAACAAAVALSSWLAYEEANELQDTQLEQVAAAIAREPLAQSNANFTPRNGEDAETHFVIRPLGSGPHSPNPRIDLALPETLRPGLQTLEQSGVRWRATVRENAAGQRFAVAQRMTVRDEVARDTALYTLLPLLILIPVLLIIVTVVLNRAFASLADLSAEVDRLDESQLAPVDDRGVPQEVLPLLQAFNRLMRRLAVAIEQQRRFISDAAHELRTPVAILTVQAENVAHLELPAPATERLTTLRQGLRRMASLIEQLLDFARVQGSPGPKVHTVALDELVRTAIEASLPLAHDKGIDLGCVRMEAATIRGDRVQAYALIRNAVDNAVRYTPGGGAVDVSLSVEGGAACLVVEDTGPGIPAEDVERVFEPFVRILGTGEAGSGLGLAIARSASQALGGRIELGARRDHRAGLRFSYRQALA
ncbi:MAG: HAMP domain-containing histidine kinase [Proteobacteria bacterium]|nr:HAMP domain-containing histidine kinase [Pseudomonadota bacterium]